MVCVGCGLPDHIDEAAQQEEGLAARRLRSKKKDHRRGGDAARRRVAGEEAALQEEGLPVRRRRCKKKGSRRGSGATRTRVAGEEAELAVSNSEGLNLEIKEEQWKCGFRREGGGEEIDISAVAEKFARCSEKLARKCGSSAGGGLWTTKVPA